MATQTTQMARAQKLKNSRVNQSIKAPRLRRRVGSAKAAKAAMPGSARSKARSDKPVNQVAPTVTATNHKGKARLRGSARLGSVVPASATRTTAPKAKLAR